MEPAAPLRPRPARRWRSAAGALAIALLWGPACGTSRAEPARWRAWRTIEWKARSGLFSGRVQMRLSDGPTGRRLDVDSVARLLGATVGRSSAVTTFDANGRIRAYTTSSRKRARRFRFGDHAYTVEKLRPRGDSDAPLDAWEVTSTREFPYTEALPGQPTIPLDFYGMLLKLHEHKLSVPGDEVTVLVATADGPQSYRVRVSELRTAQREFTDLATGDRTTARVHEQRLSITPEDPATSETFLNIEGETELWVESESKTLLEVGGKVPKIGRIKLTLAAIG